MFCVSGFSGVGKDEFCSRLVKAGAIQTGLVDPAKCHMADLYGFSEQQLFGPSKFRNEGDLRYMKNNGVELGLFKWDESIPDRDNGLYGKIEPDSRYWAFKTNNSASIPQDYPYIVNRGEVLVLVKEGDPKYWLSPREALQRYCELMNDMYQDSWVRKGIEIQQKLATGSYFYSRMGGCLKDNSSDGYRSDIFITCFSDFRHKHEFKAARQIVDSIPILVRIRSKRVPNPPYNHRSETEQTGISDDEFDFVVHNDGSVQDLHDAADNILKSVISDGIPSSTVEMRVG